MASVPPISRDALIHHLAVPKLYLNHGGIYEIPWLEFSYFPMNIDLLYIIPLYFGYDIGAKYIHFTFGLLTALLIFLYLRRHLEKKYAYLGVLFFLSVPVIVKLSITAYVDLGLVFFSTSAIYFLFLWLESDFRSTKYCILSAISCGLALGSKYNGLIVFCLLALLVPFIYVRSRSNGRYTLKGVFGYSCLYVVISIVIYSPWMIRNYIWTGNPVYPLYHNVFERADRQTPRVEATNSTAVAHYQKREDVNHFFVRKFVYNESPWEIAAIPIRIFFQGRDDDPKYFDGKLNPFLLLLLPLAFLHIQNVKRVVKIEKLVLFVYSILFILIVFFKTDMRIRYIAPVIPFLVILSVYGISNLAEIIQNKVDAPLSSILGMSAITALCLFLFSFNALYIHQLFKHVDPLPFLSGNLNRHEYIEKYRPEYPVLRWANENIDSRSRILALFLGEKGYYSDREIIFNINFLESVIKSSQSGKMIVRKLKSEKYSHLLVRYDLFANWMKNSFTMDEIAMVKELFEKYCERLFVKSGYALYQINSSISEI